ncbi:MAG: hypothetical protein ABIP03_10165 [Aquihabitans sp.]
MPEDRVKPAHQVKAPVHRPDGSAEIAVARVEPATGPSGPADLAGLPPSPGPTDLFVALGAEPIRRQDTTEFASTTGPVSRRNDAAKPANPESPDRRTDRTVHHRVDQARHRSLRRRLRRTLRVPATTVALDKRSVLWGRATAAVIVLAVMAFGMQSRTQTSDSFVTTMGPLHRDRRVVQPMADRIVDTLVGDVAVAPDARAALDRQVTDMMVSEEFDPVWRQALSDAHIAATGGTTLESATPLDRALPGLPAYLSSQGIQSSAHTDALTVTLLQGNYTTTLQRSLRLLDRATTLLPLLALALAAMALARASNRLRLGALLGSTVAALAVGGMALSFVLPHALARLVASDATLPATQIGAEQLMPLTRMLLLALATLALAIAAVCRLEEVGSAPAFRVERTRHDDLDRPAPPLLGIWHGHVAPSDAATRTAPGQKERRTQPPRTRPRSDPTVHRRRG